MRWIGWILAALLITGWVAAEVPPIVPPVQSAPADLWRRTRDGWQRADWLLPRHAPIPGWLHPGVLAAYQVTVCVAAFRSFSRLPNRVQEPVAELPEVLGRIAHGHIGGRNRDRSTLTE